MRTRFFRTVCWLAVQVCAVCGFSTTMQAQQGVNLLEGIDAGQHVEIVDDEACGCELVYIDGIQTTQRGGLYGFKLADGTELVPPTYRFVGQFTNGFCIVLRSDTTWGIINRRGEEVLPCVYQEVSLPREGLIRVKQNGLYGFADTLGRMVIECQYPAASAFSEGAAVVAVNLSTLPPQVVKQIDLEAISGINLDTLAIAYGFIDKEGQLLMLPQYEYCNPFIEGYAVVKMYGRFGVIDHQGKEVLPVKYDWVMNVTAGRCFAYVDGEGIAMFDNRFRRITPFRYSEVVGFGDDFFTVRRDSVYTYLDRRGREPFGVFDKAYVFAEGCARVERGGKVGVIDTRGHEVLPIAYQCSNRYPGEYMMIEGRVLIEREGRFGFVDKQGREVVPCIYQGAFSFSEGLAPVCQGDWWGFVDKEGRMSIAPRFQAASQHQYGRAEVLLNNETYKINRQGKCVKNCSTFPK
ncbi:MAG: WG repeat-containing protein [Bacteroidales bacterium]|nr:WG repeat-containing protein [Bacteroidales bacterium]